MEIWDFVKLISLAYLLLFAIYLLINNKVNKTNFFLAIFLLIEASSIMNTLLWRFFPFTHIHMPYLYYIDSSIFYLRGASLYLYICSYTNENFKLKYSHLFHLLPFVLITTLYFIYFHRFNNVIKTRILESGIFPPITSLFIELALHIVIVIYLLASLKEIYNYKTRLKNVYADVVKVWRNWIYFLIIGFFVIMFLDILYIIISFYFKVFPYFVVNSLNILVLLLTILIMLNGLKRPELFSILPENEPVKYIGSNLKNSDRQTIINKLDQLLIKDKRYLDPNICINDLAKEIGVLPKHLSQVINEDYKQNFFDLINSYRIEKAKELLTNNSHSSKNILEILYISGFNSKTSFNLAFKKYTGHTPTTYRRQYAG